MVIALSVLIISVHVKRIFLKTEGWQNRGRQLTNYSVVLIKNSARLRAPESTLKRVLAATQSLSKNNLETY